MNTMNMPGFTAQASLYKAGGQFRMAEAQNHLADNREVLPQLPIGFCQANCDHIQDDFLRSVCELRCTDDQGGGGGRRWQRSTLQSEVRAMYFGPQLADGWDSNLHQDQLRRLRSRMSPTGEALPFAARRAGVINVRPNQPKDA